MKTAEEYWQSRNGGKSSELAFRHQEWISPIYAVELMKSYAKQYAKEEVLMWHKVIGDFLALINRQIEDNEKPIFTIDNLTPSGDKT